MSVLVPGHCTIEGLIARAEAVGMKHVRPGLRLIGQDGERREVHYLINPATAKRFMLTEFDEGELVGPPIREAVERRLEISIQDH